MLTMFYSVRLTMTKLYPIHISCQLGGHLGTSMDWLWTAMVRVGDSHTEHLRMEHG